MNLLYTRNYTKLNQSLLNNKIPLPCLFYTYRLTYINPVTKEKFYYMGWHKGSQKDPREDGYFSSSKSVKNLVKQHGTKAFTKKIQKKKKKEALKKP